MGKRIIQAFIILIVILFGVSLISETNDKINAKNAISSFEEDVSNNKEVSNGNIENIVFEDSSNMISNLNAKVASIIVGGLNSIFNLGIKMIEGMAR